MFITSLVRIAVLLALALPGCGDSSAESTSTNPASSDTKTPENEASDTLKVTLSSLNQGEQVSSGSSTTISFTVTNQAGEEVKPASYTIELSADSGTIWTTLVADHSGDAYEWLIPTSQEPGSSYRIRITVKDENGKTATSTSAIDFTIAASSNSESTSGSDSSSGASSGESSSGSGSNTSGSSSGSSGSSSGSSNSSSTSTNKAPSISLTSHNQSGVYVRGTQSSITFAASDQDGDTLTFKIELSADAGSTWTTLATGLTNKSYTWEIPTNQAQGIRYRIRVSADDGKGHVSRATSAENFGIAQTTPTYNNDILAILDAHCDANCHSTGGTQSSRYIYDVYSNNNNAAYDLRESAFSRIEAGTMPPSGPDVSNSDKELLQLWIWSGAAQ